MSETRAPIAMILAAGLGTRLRPLTDQLPKPLLPIRGKPLLAVIMDNLQAAGCRDFVINTHHLPEQINFCIARREDRDRCTLLHEPRILGTGGALVNARDILERSTDFLLHNGDILSDAPLVDLIDQHRATDALVTLLLVDWPQVNTVTFGSDGIIKGFDPNTGLPGIRRLTYSGVAMISRAFLDLLPRSMPCSLIEGLENAIESRPGSIRAWTPEIQWSDLGTLDRYKNVLRDLEHTASFAMPGLPVEPADPPIPNDRALVLLPPQADPLLEESGFADILYGEPLALQGSDRSFRRIAVGQRKAVLMQDPEAGEDFRRFLSIARFLHDAGLGAPAILAEDPSAGLVLIEDLGDLDLNRAATGAKPQRRRELYERVIDRLLEVQSLSATAPATAKDRTLDREVLLWETAYFREWFLEREIDLPTADLRGLDLDFKGLAAAVAAQPRLLTHRDFQSRNILVCDGEIRLVDFQGLCLGPYVYDLMSLLRDPYMDITEDERRGYLVYYHSRLRTIGEVDVGGDDFQRDAVLAGLQRNMQALGAYARLCHDKGRLFYRAYMRPGLGHLREGLAQAEKLGIPDGGLSGLVAVIDRVSDIMASRGDGDDR